MAQSENMKKLHAAQEAFAKEVFEQYKTTIGTEFIIKFGGSYQRYEEIGDNWRKFYKYALECEQFLKSRTITFIGTIPENNGMCRNPRFLKSLIGKISEFLSTYVSKKYADPDKERNKCTHDLIQYFVEYPVLKNMMKKFVKNKNKEWGLHQKAKREEKQQIRKRNRIKEPVTLSPEQLERINSKSVRSRINSLKKQMTQLEISIKTVHQI